MSGKRTRRTITVTLTRQQIEGLAGAVDEARQNRVENGSDTRAMDNALERLLSAWHAPRAER